ncbi:DUF4136 domain-containing protein [Cellulophaga sp. Hel_I_12]|uniref:DUF4136 domain-containing protein n=1 Tax=Cellulophaga sp. Hel_I_12 TaxID=1249972 RepID=UPI0006477C86|nr:DUF4136 domain-containing protein [Cellulophaga sp. Hel_I_12]
MKFLVYFLLVFSFVSCTTVRVNYDYDKKADFSAYTTYSYLPEMQTGLSDLDTQRLLVLVDSTMLAKGILYSEEPDFYINIQSASYSASQNNNVGVGLGGGGRNVGGGISIGIPVGQPKLEREIKFDFVDSQKDVLFWQAVSASPFKENVSPQLREENLRVITNKVFVKYPPEIK